MNRLKFTLRDPNTNWKYLLIVILLAFIVGGGVLYYRYWWVFQKEPEVPAFEKPTIDAEEEYVEVLLDELKEGENNIGGVIVKKNKPKILYDLKNLEKHIIPSIEIKRGTKYSVAGLEVSFMDNYLGEYSDKEYYEIRGNIGDKAEIRMVGWSFGEGEFPSHIEGFSITDKNNNIVDIRGDKEIGPIAFYEDKGKVEILHYNDKVYFLIHGGMYGMKAGGSAYFLYVADQKDDIKTVSTWGCNIYEESCDLGYVLGYQNKLFFKVGEEFWEFDENDVLKNKFTAEKIVVKNGEVFLSSI